MKKTVRAIVAFFLAAVMMFGMSSAAFAADESTVKIEWNDLFGDDYEFYYSNVKLAEGENDITLYDANIDILEVDENDLRGLNTVCYEFEAEQSGYYLFTSDYDTVYSFSENYDGETASGCCEYIKYGEEPYNVIAYIEEGTNLIGATYSIESFIISDFVTIEYLGAEIKEYAVSEERLDDFIIGMNIWDDDSGEIAVAADCEISFVPEKNITVNDVVLMGVCDETPAEGKNKAVIELFGIEKEIEFTAYTIESLVKSVEITNLDKHTVFSNDYKGKRHYEDASGEVITVKFNDGTEYSEFLNESIAEIILPNRVAVTAYAGLTLNDDGSYDFIISVGDVIFAEYEVTQEDKSFFGNISTLTTDNFESLRNSANDFFVGIQYLGNDNDFMMECFGMIFDDFAQTFVNFISFIKYYIG